MKKKNATLVSLPILALLIGWLEYGPASGSQYVERLMMLYVILSLILVFVWFMLDAKERHYKASIFVKIAIAGLTILALPCYLLKSRGTVGGLKTVCLALFMFMTTMACYRIGVWLALPSVF